MFRVKPNFKRRPPRLSRVFNDRPLYFITFCTHQRKPFLACDEVHAAFAVFAKRAETSFNVAVGRYVIMPDHIHLFVSGTQDFLLTQWVRLLKRSLSKVILAPTPHWQRGFFDHLIRHGENYSEKWEYVRQNPVRAGLVATPEAWPWKGEIVRIGQQDVAC